MHNIKFTKIFYSAAVFFTCFAATMQAQAYNPKDKSEMQKFAYDSCIKTRNDAQCSCFSNALASSFTEKEWRIFIADRTQSSTPPAGINDADLKTYGEKLGAVGNSCGMQ